MRGTVGTRTATNLVCVGGTGGARQSPSNILRTAVGVIRTFARFHGIVPAELSVQVSAST